MILASLTVSAAREKRAGAPERPERLAGLGTRLPTDFRDRPDL